MTEEFVKKLLLCNPKAVSATELAKENQGSTRRAKPKLRVDTALAAYTTHENDEQTPGDLSDISPKSFPTMNKGAHTPPINFAEEMELDDPPESLLAETLSPKTVQRRRDKFFNSPDYDATMPAPNPYDEHFELLFGKPGQNERSPSPPLGSEGHEGNETVREDINDSLMAAGNNDMMPSLGNATTPPQSDPLSPSGNAVPLTGDGTSEVNPQSSTNPKPQDTSVKQMVDQKTGYTWTNEEDAPGYIWQNRKAQEEAARAWNGIVDKDQMIGSEFFCPFDSSLLFCNVCFEFS